MSDTLKSRKRHIRAYHVVRAVLFPFFKWRFNLSSQPAPQVRGPCLVLANHNADLDAVLIHFSFRELLYFVASEHVFRAGLASRLLQRYFDPISRLKGSTDIGTVREVMRRLKQGMSVCIFPEGNRSFNGLTCPIAPSIGKLAQACGVPLMTYRFEGGYFATPRWAYTLRRGRMRGYAVKVYPPEQLKAMSTEEVNAAISADLYEDAYGRQAVERVRFKGRRLAEGLETALFVCPGCERIGGLHSRGDELFCDCGLKAVYDQFGSLQGAPYSTITQWDAWQRGKLAEMALGLGEEPAFEDRGVTLVRVHPGHKSERLSSGPGSLALYRDRILCGGLAFPLEEISDMALYGRGSIAFTCGGGHYEILSDASFCGRKYLELYQQLQTKR